MRPLFLGIFVLVVLAQLGFLYLSDVYLDSSQDPRTPEVEDPLRNSQVPTNGSWAPASLESRLPSHISISSDPFLDDEERMLHTNFIEKIKSQMESNKRLADPYIFVHIAKTGGSSLYRSLMRARGRGLVLSHFWHHENINPEAVASTSVPGGSVHVVGGHLCYGLHHWWENRTNSDYTYFTVLRDPISRVMSHYRYHLKPTDSNHFLTKNRTFTEWAMNVKYAQNVMTGYMAGVEPYAWWNREVPRLESGSLLFPDTVITEKQYRIARRHLITSIVGLQEEYESSLNMFNHYFGLQLINTYANSGVTKYNFSEKERAVIAMVNHWDIELYKLGMYLYRQLQQLAK